MFLLALCAYLTGCAAVAVTPFVGAAAVKDTAEVDIAVSPGISKKTLESIRRISVFLESEGRTTQHTLPPAGTAVSASFKSNAGPTQKHELLDQLVNDYVGLGLMKIGYDIVERRRLETVVEEQALQQTGLLDQNHLIKAGKVLGLQAIVLGSYIPSQKLNIGVLKGGGITHTIKQASFKLVGIEEARTLIMVIVSYGGAGGNFKEVSEHISMLIAEQLKGEPISAQSMNK